MEYITNQGTTPIFVETGAYEGVKRIAETLASDFELVTGRKPECMIKDNLDGIKDYLTGTKDNYAMIKNSRLIFCATLGKSPLLEQLFQDGKLKKENLEGKREVFEIKLLKAPFEGVEEALVICGSDKRGTIYGMFTLSEYIGVSPLLFWGDAKPMPRENITIGEDIEQLSREPSVKYRGFFINDEWPCFGTWVNEQYGGFNATAYKEVFEFILRMKGNYLWPAMWTASFPLDGPGSGNEELADLYGVVMEYSHHEPCLRASEEWDKVRGEDSIYGNEWNFYTNEKGLLKYWEDALKRSGKYDNIITIGMRGERDSSMLGPNATVEENVNLLKDIICKQRQLIKENVNEDLSKVPQMIALYKEVEQYFYGETRDGIKVGGLKDYEELDGVICMLCEDNFGHMRTLPTEDIRNRNGGFGMYYHYDYHGDPISYEWVDSTPLSKTWEQMCMAYEYGIKDIWIVNVGDLKFHEVPLQYFMALAYDYEKWGYGNPDSYRDFTAELMKKCFPEAGSELQEKIARVFTDYIDMNHCRRPEALHAGIYHPCHYGETKKMLAKAQELERLSEEVYAKLCEREKKAYYSMIHFSAMASMNLIKMHLYAGLNQHYVNQGKTLGNEYARLTQECIDRDEALIKEWSEFQGGKWNGMQLASHIGFTKWNDDGCRYPVISTIKPAKKPRLVVSRSDSEETACKNYGKPCVILVDDFLYEGCDEVTVEACNDGIGTIGIKVRGEQGEIPSWLSVEYDEKPIETLGIITLRCNRDLLAKEEDDIILLIEDGETAVALDVQARKENREKLPPMTFLSGKDAIVMDAKHYCDKKDTAKGGFKVIESYGKYGSGVKVFPSTAVFSKEEEKPELTYRFLIREEGEYQVEVLTAPTNSVVNKQAVHLMLRTDSGREEILEILPKDFRAGEVGEARWAKGVLDQIRVSSTVLPFKTGISELTIGAMEAGLVVERIRIYPKDKALKESYFGPHESVWK